MALKTVSGGQLKSGNHSNLAGLYTLLIKRLNMNCFKLLLIHYIFLFGSLISGNGQNIELNNFVNRLNNKDARMDLLLVAPPVDTLKNHPLAIHTLELHLSSVNVFLITRQFGIEHLMSHMNELLTDTTRDWYANLILYEITHRNTDIFLKVKNRDDWVEPRAYMHDSTYKQKDIEMWKNNKLM
ncbi:MAG: hypothetical protein J7539_18530 [Niabella sp.]|nr:hypothetical protein [Niabella sp.]